VATAVLATGVAILLALGVMLAFGQVRAITVGYVALIVTGVGMLLRERVFTAATG
jgi:hypothetical protein